jgi:hypothetical protein
MVETRGFRYLKIDFPLSPRTGPPRPSGQHSDTGTKHTEADSLQRYGSGANEIPRPTGTYTIFFETLFMAKITRLGQTKPQESTSGITEHDSETNVVQNNSLNVQKTTRSSGTYRAPSTLIIPHNLFSGFNIFAKKGGNQKKFAPHNFKQVTITEKGTTHVLRKFYPGSMTAHQPTQYCSIPW